MAESLKNARMTAKKTWDTIKEFLNKPNGKPLPPAYFSLDNDCITDSKQIANKFNEYFVNIGPNLASNIETQDKQPFSAYLKSKVNTTFSFKTIDESTTSKIISHLKPKNSTGFDNISLKLLKLSSNYIISPLASINQSIFDQRNFSR